MTKKTKKLFILLAVVALFAAACGDSSTESGEPSGTEAPAPTEPGATDPPATEPPATDAPTSEPPATAAPTTAAPEADPLLELALGVVGSWSGEWTNTTFGSVGPISGEITVDEAAMELTVNADVGGFVFGSADPDPELLTLPLTVGDHTGTSPTFGDWTLTIAADGTFSMISTNISALPGGTFTLDGALTDGGIEATYEVDFGDGSGAEGVVSIVKS